MNNKPEEQPEENPNVGKQFEEIMGQNFTPREESEAAGKALGAHIWDSFAEIAGLPKSDASEEELQIHRNHEFQKRATHFPTSMIRDNGEGELEVYHKDPDGWEHTWSGGPYITHHHPKHGPIEVTNLVDYSLPWGEQPYEKDLFTPHEFLNHVKDFSQHKSDYDNW
jgi:hypothetical protein